VTEERTIDVDGQSLRIRIRRGAGTPLLIFNGIGASFELLDPFVDALKDVEVIVFDVPGVGGSAAPRLPYRFSGLARLATRCWIPWAIGIRSMCSASRGVARRPNNSPLPAVSVAAA